MQLVRSGVLVVAWVVAAQGEAGALATAGRVLWAPVVYVGGRVADLLEVVDLNLGVGAGGKADVKYGVNFLGAGRVDAVRFGLADGTLDLWSEQDREVGLFPFSLLGWPAHLVGRMMNEPGVSNRAWHIAVDYSLGTETMDRRWVAWESRKVVQDVLRAGVHTTWGNSLPLGAELHPGLVGVRVTAKPLQAVDFALGFVGIDLDPVLARRPF
jgi:hypothetical protein